MTNLERVLRLAKDMAGYIHHIGFLKYDGGHSEPEETCPHPDCLAVREAEAQAQQLVRKDTNAPCDCLRGRNIHTLGCSWWSDSPSPREQP